MHDEATVADERGRVFDDAEVGVTVVDDDTVGGDGTVLAGEVADLAGCWGGGVARGSAGVVGV